jgi:hypothetical protein
MLSAYVDNIAKIRDMDGVTIRRRRRCPNNPPGARSQKPHQHSLDLKAWNRRGAQRNCFDVGAESQSELAGVLACAAPRSRAKAAAHTAE